MSITHVLAVVPVSDLNSAQAWYEKLFNAPPTNIPMPGLLAEWQLTDTGWIQLTLDKDRAGSGLFNVAVANLDDQVRALAQRGLTVADSIDANKNVQLRAFHDPDGNTVTFIGNFRVEY